MTEPTTSRASGEMNDLVLDIKAQSGEMRDWVLDIKAQIEKEQGRKKRSIYKLPRVISELNEKAYQPQFVSFGPYHHGEPHLKPMEHHKQRAFLNFLKSSPASVSLDTIFDSMVEVAQDLKDSYDSLRPEWQDDIKKFVKLMIVDGCFMLEIFRVAQQGYMNDYSEDDPIFGHNKNYVRRFIRRDMLLLENQLPMLVLFKLKLLGEIKGLWNDKVDMENLNNLILEFLGFRGYKYKDIIDSEKGKSLHILDLFRKGLLVKRSSEPTTYSAKPIPFENHGLNQSAMGLKEAGIRFRRSESNSLMDISFDDGILRLPEFIVNDTAESTYQNLVAFERCHIGAGHDITSFICFMDTIIHDDRDITLLCSEGIIRNLVGSDKVVANLFHTVSKDLVIDPFNSNLSNVIMEIIYYSGKSWHKRRAELIHTYFRNPWAIVSVVAAVLLFTLTALQTVFTGYDVMHK